MRRSFCLIVALLLVSCSTVSLNKIPATVAPVHPLNYVSENLNAVTSDHTDYESLMQNRINTLLDSIKGEKIDVNSELSASIGLEIVGKAMEYLGCAYGSGQSGPKKFDCSGFTSFIFRKFGVELHRSSGAQFLDGEEIKDRHELRPGDLVYFNGHKIGSRIGHVGIVTEANPYTGEFYFIHSAITGGVRIDFSKQEYYRARYMGARRIFN